MSLKELRVATNSVAGRSAGRGATDGESTIVSKTPFNINDKEAIEAAFSKFAEEVADSDIEKAIVFSPDGYRYDIIGTANMVNIELIGKESLKGAIDIHNHTRKFPDSFSRDDFVNFFEYKTAMMEVVYNGKRHRMEWDETIKRPTDVEAHALYNNAWYAIHEEAKEKGQRVQAEHYEVMLYLQKTVKGLRFHEL